MKKYFKLTRSDGVYWQTKKISALLVKENLWSIERKLRKCYYSDEWIEHDGYKYYLEKFKIETLEGIEFGKFNAEKEVVKRSVNDIDIFEVDEYDLEKDDLIALLIKTKRQLQKRMDTQRIERKAWRMEDRNTSIIGDTISELLDKVKEFDSFGIVRKQKNKEMVGILQLSDWHLGEVVEMEDNIFNFEVAKERVEKLASRAIKEFEDRGISEIYLLSLGDLINLDSHRDKLLTNEAVRAKSLDVLYKLYKMMIDSLLTAGFELKLASVVGNESRINSKEYMSHVDNIAIDSFDYILMMMLYARYGEIKSIKFLNKGEYIEYLVNINGKNILMSHGNNINHNRLEDEVGKIKLRWFKKKGVMLDYVLLGHIHSTLITDNYARNASLVGANPYSDKALNIHSSHASQNIGFVGENIDIMSIKLN